MLTHPSLPNTFRALGITRSGCWGFWVQAKKNTASCYQKRLEIFTGILILLLPSNLKSMIRWMLTILPPSSLITYSVHVIHHKQDSHKIPSAAEPLSLLKSLAKSLRTCVRALTLLLMIK